MSDLGDWENGLKCRCHLDIAAMFGDTEFDSYDGGFHPSPVYLEDEEYLDSYGEDMDAESAESMKDEGVYYERISLSELMDQCIIPTLSQAIQTIYPLMVLCLICRVTCVFCFKGNFIFAEVVFSNVLNVLFTCNLKSIMICSILVS